MRQPPNADEPSPTADQIARHEAKVLELAQVANVPRLSEERNTIHGFHLEGRYPDTQLCVDYSRRGGRQKPPLCLGIWRDDLVIDRTNTPLPPDEIGLQIYLALEYL